MSKNRVGRPNLHPNQIEEHKATLITQCKALAEKLGRAPTISEFSNDTDTHCHDTAVRIFGSWNEFLKASNLRFTRVTGTEKQELINRVLDLSKQLGRTPTRQEFNEHSKTNNLGTSMVVQRHFGTWTEFLEYCNLQPNITREFKRRKDKL